MSPHPEMPDEVRGARVVEPERVDVHRGHRESRPGQKIPRIAHLSSWSYTCHHGITPAIMELHLSSYGVTPVIMELVHIYASRVT